MKWVERPWTVDLAHVLFFLFVEFLMYGGYMVMNPETDARRLLLLQLQMLVIIFISFTCALGCCRLWPGREEQGMC